MTFKKQLKESKWVPVFRTTTTKKPVTINNTNSL
jgi:hypothetical protein